MKKNMGTTDRIVRLIIAMAILIFTFTNIIPQNLKPLGLFIAAILVLTSFVSFCPMYFPFGYRTNKP